MMNCISHIHVSNTTPKLRNTINISFIITFYKLCNLRLYLFVDIGVPTSNGRWWRGILQSDPHVPAQVLAKQSQSAYICPCLTRATHQGGGLADQPVPWTDTYTCHFQVSTGANVVIIKCTWHPLNCIQ